MKVFVNDKPLIFVRYDVEKDVKDAYDSVLWGDDVLIAKKLVGKVLIHNITTFQIDKLIELMEVKKMKKLESITITLTNYEDMTEYFKDHFKIVKAAGGLVKKESKFLMIYRLHRWDLPKGKLDKGESAAIGAVREVEEECMIKAQLDDHICTTWHTYVRKGRRILKKTDWYKMQCLDDSNMQPQLEEFIEEVRWMNMKEVDQALLNSYHSIWEVFDAYKLQQLNNIR